MRHPLEVALSLKRRNQNSYSLGLALWERYYATVLDQVPAERRIVTHYDTFFVDPEGELARLCAFAGLEPADPGSAPTSAITPSASTSPTPARARASGALRGPLPVARASTPPRDAPVDEGRVRRLILDGAVAQRHADQRQAAIDRLQEREQELRAERAETEAPPSHATFGTSRADGAAVGTSAVEQMQRDTAATLATLQTSVAQHRPPDRVACAVRGARQPRPSTASCDPDGGWSVAVVAPRRPRHGRRSSACRPPPSRRSGAVGGSCAAPWRSRSPP